MRWPNELGPLNRLLNNWENAACGHAAYKISRQIADFADPASSPGAYFGRRLTIASTGPDLFGSVLASLEAGQRRRLLGIQF